jgi:hypothetical protein
MCSDHPCPDNPSSDSNGECPDYCIPKIVDNSEICQLDSCIAYTYEECNDHYTEKCSVSDDESICRTQNCSFFDKRLFIL